MTSYSQLLPSAVYFIILFDNIQFSEPIANPVLLLAPRIHPWGQFFNSSILQF